MMKSDSLYDPVGRLVCRGTADSAGMSTSMCSEGDRLGSFGLFVFHSLTDVRSVEIDGLWPADDSAVDWVEDSDGAGECIWLCCC